MQRKNLNQRQLDYTKILNETFTRINMQLQNRPTDELVIKTFCLSKSVSDRFQNVCDKEMRKYSNVIQRLIERYIDGKE